MIEDLLKNTSFQFILAIATLVGGISASIHIGSLLISYRKLLVAGSRSVLSWFVILSIPLVLVVSSLGMSHIFGTQINLLLGAVGFAFCATAYLVPALVRMHWESGDRFLVVIVCAFYVLLLICCALAMFSAAYFASIGPAPEFAVFEHRMWSIFSLLEILHFIGIVYVYRIQSVNLSQRSIGAHEGARS